MYGLNYASGKFWLRVKSIFKELGLRKLDGDEAVYYKLNEEGNLAGMVSTHVDDFDVAGRTKFVEILIGLYDKITKLELSHSHLRIGAQYIYKHSLFYRYPKNFEKKTPTSIKLIFAFCSF